MSGVDLRPHPVLLHEVLPAEAPLEMPTQDLWAAPSHIQPEDGRRLRSSDGWRFGMLAATAVATFFPARTSFDVLTTGEVSALDVVTLVLFVMLFAWGAFGLVIALTGFCLMVSGGTDDSDADLDLGAPHDPLTGRTALLMPIYEEDAVAVFARLEAMRQSLEAAGADRFDLFVLSDTRDADVREAETRAFQTLKAAAAGPVHAFYRHRAENVGRKAGNIAEWVRRFGGAYETMLVLDADSLMEGDTMLRLAAAMQRNPRLGLLQTVPVISNRTSLFGRLMQFASRLYGPMLSEGLAWWSGPEGNYWGHNAMIRVRAFAEQAGLPTLPGWKPFGGEILSHDFVEAALLRRGGWIVRMAPHLWGSYEECPPTLPDSLVRERRWCQGNLQHSTVIVARGLHWTSRLHLIRGVSAYLMAPLWLAFVICGALEQRDAMRSQDISDAGSLYLLAWLYAIGLGVLFAPKVLSLILVLTRGEELRRWGGPWRLTASFAFESVMATLMAPVLLMAQLEALTGILIGRDAGWRVQRRTDGGLRFGEAARRHGAHTLLGVILAAWAWLTSVETFLWFSPIIVGLILAIPLALATASVDFGQGLARLGLLATPEEREPPPILASYARIVAQDGTAGAGRASAAGVNRGDGLHVEFRHLGPELGFGEAQLVAGDIGHQG